MFSCSGKYRHRQSDQNYREKNFFFNFKERKKRTKDGTSLAVQWLKTQCFHCCGPGFDSGSGTRDPTKQNRKNHRAVEFPRGSITKAGPLSMCRSLLWGVQAGE